MELTELMYHYVWNTDKMGRLGRPNSSVDEYYTESEVKISNWKSEQQSSNNPAIRARLKNKISALRSRMK